MPLHIPDPLARPFGLVMVEAMARRQLSRWLAPSRVIQDGVTGFVVDTFDEALRAIDRVKTIERQRVRTTFERRFTARRMAEDYVRIYQNVIATCASPPLQAGSINASISTSVIVSSRVSKTLNAGVSD
jgi:glycosyltransferase involved in cell wall biosynthesis